MNIKKIHYTNDNVKELSNTILMQMHRDNWKPDYIVGLTRGGLVPAVYMSHYLDVPMETLQVSFRDHNRNESNCWMSEDAFGYDCGQKNILIVDDINDTGATLDWIINDWQSTCGQASDKWDTVWGNTVRFAVLVDNLSSSFTHKVNYSGTEINKLDDDVWIVYPWEQQ